MVMPLGTRAGAAHRSPDPVLLVCWGLQVGDVDMPLGIRAGAAHKMPEPVFSLVGVRGGDAVVVVAVVVGVGVVLVVVGEVSVVVGGVVLWRFHRP